jgi:hypothetical protein
MTTPKAFISYSWSSQAHRDLIRSYAERLTHDGVNVILDQWDLSEGQDKYAFMERAVTDLSVTHVLIFSDKQYAEKADERKAGVGTESQLISKEIYEKVGQKKFIPIKCELDENGEPYMPAFLKSRIAIDFSTPEAANRNWEQLLRVLFGKPLYEKPELGTPPSFLTEQESRPSLPTIGKFSLLKDALLNARPSVELLRKDFLASAIAFADKLRVREQPTIEHIDEKILADLRTLLPLRDQLVDWLMIESSLSTPRFDDIVTSFLENILALKYRPLELTAWNEAWFDTHALFVYEMFLYVVAILIANDKYNTVRHVLDTHYLLPDTEAQRGSDFVAYHEFYTYSKALEYRNNRLSLQRPSLEADTIKERSTHKDISFKDVMQAELVIFLVTLLSDDRQWYPHTLIYMSRGGMRFPLFVRAAQHKYFERLKIITGIGSGDEFRARFEQACQRKGVTRWANMRWAYVSLPQSMNIMKLDTLE